MEAGLSRKETELLAVGASIAAGCRPCTAYHVKKAHEAGAAGCEIRQAVDAALYVRETATEIMAGLADELLDRGSSTTASNGYQDTQIGQLVSVGAALAVNCVASFGSHVEAALQLGASRKRIEGAIEVARVIKREAAKRMNAEAESPIRTAVVSKPKVKVASASRWPQEERPPRDSAVSGNCGCGNVDADGEAGGAARGCDCG
jgi:AhpD family alkylhydroperoxidase